MTESLEHSYVEEARREKLAALRALGVNPFAYRFDRSHTSAAALGAYDDAMGDDGPEVAVAGRLVSFRGKGKTAFGHLEDVAGRIQVYFRQDDLADSYYVVKLLDLDDHLGVDGQVGIALAVTGFRVVQPAVGNGFPCFGCLGFSPRERPKRLG